MQSILLSDLIGPLDGQSVKNKGSKTIFIY